MKEPEKIAFGLEARRMDSEVTGGAGFPLHGSARIFLEGIKDVQTERELSNLCVGHRGEKILIARFGQMADLDWR